MDGNSSSPLRAENTQGQGTLEIKDHKSQIGSVTGIEAFESAGTLVLEVRVPSRHTRKLKSWVRRSQRIEQHAQQFIPESAEHQNSGAQLSPQSSSYGR